MKKLLIVLLFFAVIFASVIPTQKPIFAQNIVAEDMVIEMPQEKIATPPADPDYIFAYPGVLPDNPLYFLKAIRDKAVSFLINDPLKKAEFDLLTSDKRIYAAQMLVNKGKDDLAISTLSKSNNYFDGALSSSREAKKMGKNVDSFAQNLRLAANGHKKVIADMEDRLGKKFKAQLQAEQLRLEGFAKSASKLDPN